VIQMLLRLNGLPISSGFQALDSAHSSPHSGIDIVMKEGTPLRAVADGVVERLTDYGADNIGRGVILRLQDGSQVVYGHLEGFTVHLGQKVSAGQVLGYSGSTGNSTGPHLHLGLIQNGKFIDPGKYVDAVLKASPEKKTGTLEGIREGLDAIREAIHAIGHGIKAIVHWLNPHTWYDAGYQVFHSGALDTPLIVGTVGGIVILMLGASWPKKWLFWGWILFWALRGWVFA
jgi:hypothetical protein